MYRASGMAGRIMHGTLLLLFWRDPSMVMTYYSSQLHIQSGYSRQQPSTYLEKRRYFMAREKFTCHRCASTNLSWRCGRLQPWPLVDQVDLIAIFVVVELPIND